MAELENAYCDLQAMQATLQDSALYVRQLRRRITELELWQQQQQQHQQQSNKSLKDGLAGDGQQDKDQGESKCCVCAVLCMS